MTFRVGDRVRAVTDSSYRFFSRGAEGVVVVESTPDGVAVRFDSGTFERRDVSLWPEDVQRFGPIRTTWWAPHTSFTLVEPAQSDSNIPDPPQPSTLEAPVTFRVGSRVRVVSHAETEFFNVGSEGTVVSSNPTHTTVRFDSGPYSREGSWVVHTAGLRPVPDVGDRVRATRGDEPFYSTGAEGLVARVMPDGAVQVAFDRGTYRSRGSVMAFGPDGVWQIAAGAFEVVAVGAPPAPAPAPKPPAPSATPKTSWTEEDIRQAMVVLGWDRIVKPNMLMSLLKRPTIAAPTPPPPL